MLSLAFWTPVLFWLCSCLLGSSFLCAFSCFVLCFSSCLLFKDYKSQAQDYPLFSSSCSVPSPYVFLSKLRLISNSTLLICTLWVWSSPDQVFALIFYTRQLIGFPRGWFIYLFCLHNKNKILQIYIFD